MPKSRLYGAYFVLFVWGVSVADGMVTRDYSAIQYVTPIALIVAGYMFGIQIIRKKNGEGDED